VLPLGCGDDGDGGAGATDPGTTTSAASTGTTGTSGAVTSTTSTSTATTTASSSTSGSDTASGTASTTDATTGTTTGTATSDGTATDPTTTAASATDTDPAPIEFRIATFNISFYRSFAGGLLLDLEGGSDRQAQQVAEVIQTIAPDVILLNEFDWDAAGDGVRVFREQYLQVSQNGAPAITYPHVYIPVCNTGLQSGVDLNDDGFNGGPDDAFGFGQYNGQYCFAVLSKYPILTDEVRTFQTLKWTDMPGALLPDDASTPAPGDWYTPEALAVFRLSSKTHADVPIDVMGETVHVLASHPTPPGFDGAEDRNGRRNHDEIRLWADYLTPSAAGYLVDDAGVAGGLAETARFVIMGDQNADPVDGGSVNMAIRQLLDHPRVAASFVPESAGAVETAASDGGANNGHQGDPKFDTADFSDGSVGNLRVDYVLPSTNLGVNGGAVFWPAASDPQAPLAGVSDHHMVWLDLEMVP
jgi:endonuclease/exonuclease/phosphatase family metal-dependent hydrolase